MIKINNIYKITDIRGNYEYYKILKNEKDKIICRAYNSKIYYDIYREYKPRWYKEKEKLIIMKDKIIYIKEIDKKQLNYMKITTYEATIDYIYKYEKKNKIKKKKNGWLSIFSHKEKQGALSIT